MESEPRKPFLLDVNESIAVNRAEADIACLGTDAPIEFFAVTISRTTYVLALTSGKDD